MSNDNRSGAAPSTQKSHADLIAEMRWQAKQPVIASGGEVFHPVDESDILDFAKELAAAHKREAVALKQRINELNAEVAAKDAVIQRLDAELRQLQEKREITIAAQKAKAAAEGYADGKRDATSNNAPVPSNEAKLREALRQVKDWFIESNDQTVGVPRMLSVIREALASTSSEVPSAPSVPSVPSDTAKLREVAEFVAHIDDNGYTSHDVQCAIDKARAAIAAPPRNCERFQTKDAAREAFQKLRGHRVMADVSLWDDRDEIEAFLDWLFALGKEGGAK